MSKKKQKIFFYKCDVIDCENKVYSPGAICPECLEKICSDLWNLSYCVFCKRIIRFIDQNVSALTGAQKINSSTCKYCVDTDCIFPF
ncbi:MAG: hypothetical protein K6T54_11550 [Ignavibacterium sp.]|nr:hypothetical protein [Ignavibacterium sp.]